MKFRPELWKIYKYYSSDGDVIKIYYKFDEATDVFYYVTVDEHEYVDHGHEFARFLIPRGSDHADGKIKSEQAHELIDYVFTYWER